MKKAIQILTFTAIIGAASVMASAQNIIFTSLDGDRIDLETQRGKVVVMAIGASWLPLSEDQASTINKLAKRYSGRDDIVMYFIATDSSSSRSKNFASDEDLRRFGARNKLSVSILRDSEGQQSTRKFNIDQLPAYIILDKNGRIAGDPISGFDPLSKVDMSTRIAKRVDGLF